MTKKRSYASVFSEGSDSLRKLQRSQFVILVLALLLLFLLLNATYGYTDMSTSSVRPLMLTVDMLVGIVAVLSGATLAMSYRDRKRK
jgi:threonine/homoserine/homoserine lactone efflux protein